MDEGVVVSLLILFAAGASLLLGMSLEETDWKQDLIDRGYAIYCPLNGEWAYREDGCDD